MPKQYLQKFRNQVALSIQNGLSIIDASQQYQISPSTLYRWVKEQRQVEAGLSIKDYTILRQKNNRQEHILEIIHLSEIIDNVPLRKRLEILEGLHNQYEQYNVHELCEALNVSRGTFYNHIFRRVDRTKYMEEQQDLMLRVQQIFDNSQQTFGAEKIRVTLAEQDIHVGKKRIREVMKVLGLESIRKDAKRAYKKRQEYQKQNLLNRDFSASCQNEIWVSDITSFKVKNHVLYLCVIIDLFSRRVVGYRVSRKCSTHLVTSAFRAAFQERGEPTGLIFHSDRGGQYISKTFCSLLRQRGVIQSFSRSGRPCDNAVAETFFATYKKEEAYRRDYSSEADFRKNVDAYIRFYNHTRPIRPWHSRPRRVLKNYLEGKRDKIYENSVSKIRTSLRFFAFRFGLFRRWVRKWPILKIQSYQRIQAEAGPLFDKKVRKVTPFQMRAKNINCAYFPVSGYLSGTHQWNQSSFQNSSAV